MREEQAMPFDEEDTEDAPIPEQTELPLP